MVLLSRSLKTAVYITFLIATSKSDQHSLWKEGFLVVHSLRGCGPLSEGRCGRGCGGGVCSWDSTSGET